MIPHNKKSHDTFIKEISEISDDYVVLGKYSGKDTKILFKHSICNSEFLMSPHNFLSGCRCPVCAKTIRRQKKVISYDNFISNIENKNPDILNNIEILTKKEDFLGVKQKIQIKHLKSNTIINITASKLYSYKLNRDQVIYDSDSFKKKISDISSDIIAIDDYKSSTEKILFKCTVCNNTFKRSPNNFINNPTCPKCKIEKKKNMEFDKFIEKASSRRDDFNEFTIDKNSFKDWRSRVYIKHNICGRTFNMNPHDFTYSGYGCIYCRKSKAEKRIENFLNKNNIFYETEKKFDDCVNKKALPFDFFIPHLNTAIEYDGEFHYKQIKSSNLEYVKNNDNIKTKYCEEKNICLIRIPYFLYNSIDDILYKLIHCEDVVKYLESLKAQRLSKSGEIPQQE